MERLTTDHSYVQELLDRGVIDPAQARHHPQRNILTRALGKLQVQGHRVDTISGPVRSGDTFLLCSDGLTDMLGETEISDIVTSARDPHSACDSLVDAALRAGGHDNVSVLIVQVGKDRG
jgi:protein phosphatase